MRTTAPAPLKEADTTDTTAEESTTTTASMRRRILDAMMIERPAKSAKPAKKRRLELNYTLKEEAFSWRVDGFKYEVQVPIWFAERGFKVCNDGAIRNFIFESRSIFDPIRGEEAREEFLRQWEDVMSYRDTWKNRDSEPTLPLSIYLHSYEKARLDALSGFLRVTREVIFVAVLCAAAMKLTTGPGYRIF